MHMYLKIVNENRGWSPIMTLGDVANVQHVFTWNDAHQAYSYAPTSQEESDNIIATNWQFAKFPWRVAPIIESGPTAIAGAAPAPIASGPPKIPPYVKPELYAEYPLADLLLLCADAGFTPEGNQTDIDSVRRQLHRYYEGRAWASEEIKQLRAKVETKSSPVEVPTSTLTTKTIVTVIPEADAPDVAPPRKYTGKKRGRKPKFHAVTKAA